MNTVNQVIKTLLPNGSNPIIVWDSKVYKRSDWQGVPNWPPDLFAVVATLTEISGSYSSNRYGAKSKTNPSFFSTSYRSRVVKEGRAWRNSASPSKRVQKLWNVILKYKNDKISKKNHAWRDAAMELLATADEACKGIGIDDQNKLSKIGSIAQLRYVIYQRLNISKALTTVCTAVPPEIVCVQPKTMTSQVGCTVRSLSHHLALLPSSTEVETNWQFYGNHLFKNAKSELNILAVPFPFRIDESAFEARGLIKNAQGGSGHFHMKQTWLPNKDRSEKVFNFLMDVLDEARENGEKIHGIVLPELALDEKTAVEVAQALSFWTDLHFFVSGVSTQPTHKRNPAKNQAFTCFFHNGDTLPVYQSKHHRWKLDQGQIDRYRIADCLDPQKEWWENIDIEDRKISFFTVRPGAIMTTLVCEDLARIDPVQPVVRSIGPNLVLALLQDGPQLMKRWPGRYATVLSEDPGSSVLTMTSLGMIERSMDPGDHRSSRIIALWKDSRWGALELDIPRNCHGLIINLKMTKAGNMTLDGRTDSKGTTLVSLIGTRSIKLEKLPSWIKSW